MPEPRVIARGTVKPCCVEPSNLDVIESKSHVEVKRCRACSCRHFRAFMVERPAGSFTPVG